jgi:nuclear pore complex protein Nup93
VDFFRHYLLAASGISPGHALRDLKALDAQASIPSPFKQVEGFDPDNEKFMKSVQQRGRQAMVAESLARVHRDFDTFLEEKVNMNWDDQRRKIFQHFGLSSRDDLAGGDSLNRGSFGRSATHPRQPGGATGTRSVFGRSGLEKSVIGQPGGSLSSSQLFADHGDRGDVGAQGPDTRFLREKMGLFARKVGELNAARLEEKPYAIFHEFGSVEDHPAGDVCAQQPSFFNLG